MAINHKVSLLVHVYINVTSWPPVPPRFSLWTPSQVNGVGPKMWKHFQYFEQLISFFFVLHGKEQYTALGMIVFVCAYMEQI